MVLTSKKSSAKQKYFLTEMLNRDIICNIKNEETNGRPILFSTTTKRKTQNGVGRRQEGASRGIFCSESYRTVKDFTYLTKEHREEGRTSQTCE